MGTTARVLLAVGVLAAAVGAGVGAVGIPAAAPDGAAVFQTGDRFDRAVFTIRVYPNGSARWVFRYERPLANDTEAARFRAFAREFRTNETPLFRDFRNQSRALVAAGADATGRSMRAVAFRRDANVTTVLGNRIGFVRMSFRWTSFAVVTDDRVVVGDVFQGQLYLGPNQSLVVEPGDDLRFAAVAPPGIQENPDSLPASGSVTWRGERTFSDGRPRIEFVPAGATAGPTARTTATTTAAAGSGGLPAWGIAAAALLLGALGVWLYARRGGGIGGAVRDVGPDIGGSPAEVSDEELLDDEQRVTTLLEEHGGRMRQSEIVEETGWSKSKVSMVLSEMEESEDVSRIRVGRENIVSLPGKEPDAAGSPYDDEP